MNSLPKTVTRQCHDCDLNPGPTPESSMLTRRLTSDKLARHITGVGSQTHCTVHTVGPHTEQPSYRAAIMHTQQQHMPIQSTGIGRLAIQAEIEHGVQTCIGNYKVVFPKTT